MIDSTRKDRTLLYVIAALMVSFITWASIARVDEYTRGQGKVVPVSGAQVIQSLEGGILQDLEVSEGDRVTVGQKVAVLDDTGVRSEYEDLLGRSAYLRAKLARIRAELAEEDEIVFAEDLSNYPNILRTERTLFEARRRRIRELKETQAERERLTRSELSIIEGLGRSGAASKSNIIQLQRSLADMQQDVAENLNTYYQELATDLAENEAELLSVRQQLSQKKDVLERTVLRSPVDGIVNKRYINTRGGVLGAGEKIMEIVPIGDRQIIEAEIDPKDVAFLSTGQPASVKLTAYDYTIYGMLEGELVHISPDTILDQTRPDAQPYYAVRIRTDGKGLEDATGEPLPIIPGMIAEVNIQTGNRRVITSLLKPLLRGTEAFSQR